MKEDKCMDYIYDVDGNAILIENQKLTTKENVVGVFLECRKSKGLTQAELAQLAGMARTNITRFESGNYNPSLELLVKVAAAMGKKVVIQLEDE